MLCTDFSTNNLRRHNAKIIVFLFVGLTTKGPLLYFDLLVHLVECPYVSTSKCNLYVILCIIIGDVQQFIETLSYPFRSLI